MRRQAGRGIRSQSKVRSRLTAGGRWIRTIGSASWRAHEVRPDSLPERAGFELSVPGDGELCWGALALGCIRGDRSAGAGTVQCDFFCSAGLWPPHIRPGQRRPTDTVFVTPTHDVEYSRSEIDDRRAGDTPLRVDCASRRLDHLQIAPRNRVPKPSRRELRPGIRVERIYGVMHRSDVDDD